jgi:hypothetical protein
LWEPGPCCRSDGVFAQQRPDTHGLPGNEPDCRPAFESTSQLPPKALTRGARNLAGLLPDAPTPAHSNFAQNAAVTAQGFFAYTHQIASLPGLLKSFDLVCSQYCYGCSNFENIFKQRPELSHSIQAYVPCPQGYPGGTGQSFLEAKR